MIIPKEKPIRLVFSRLKFPGLQLLPLPGQHLFTLFSCFLENINIKHTELFINNVTNVTGEGRSQLSDLNNDK